MLEDANGSKWVNLAFVLDTHFAAKSGDRRRVPFVYKEPNYPPPPRQGDREVTGISNLGLTVNCSPMWGLVD